MNRKNPSSRRPVNRPSKAFTLVRRARTVSALTVLGSLLVACSAAAQGDVRRVDLSADLIASDIIDGSRVNRLEGSVVLTEDSTVLRADRATEYVARDLILFTGNVTIEEESDTLFADVLRYDRKTRIGEASGRVRLSDGEVQVSGPVGRYDADDRYAWFEDGVTLVDSTAVLRSKQGEYWSREKRALFRDDVTLDKEGAVTAADSIEYFRDTEIAVASGNVRVEQTDSSASDGSSTRTWVFGDQLRTDRDGSRSTARGRVLMLRVSVADSAAVPDTLALGANHLVATDSDSVESVVATGDVAIYRDEVAALADSARMVQSTADTVAISELSLYRDPVLWYRETQLTGDSIRVRLKDEAVDSIFVYGGATMAREDTVLSKIQQVQGDRIQGQLVDGTGVLSVSPDARVVLFVETDGEPNGAVRAAASKVDFVFEADTLTTITWSQDIDGTYYDESIIPAGLALDGFRWQPERRPSRASFMADPRASVLFR